MYAVEKLFEAIALIESNLMLKRNKSTLFTYIKIENEHFSVKKT
jgi:hypothetical protein